MRSYSGCAAKRSPVRTGWMMPPFLLHLRYKEQSEHVWIRDSSRCFLSVEE